MTPRISAHEVETVPERVSVRDFDQLDTGAKQYVVELSRQGSPREVPREVAVRLASSELVNYTDYLRIHAPDAHRVPDTDTR